MSLEEQFRYLVGAYYGVIEMDEYDLKVYVLKDIENYIRNFVECYKIENFDYIKESFLIEKEVSLKTKLHDSLLLLNKIDGPIELILMIKKKLKELE